MATSLEAVKELRELTGMGILECKRALEEADGNLDKAKAILKERGFIIATSKSQREASQGVVAAYIHSNGKIGAMVELNCETDFVARTEIFQNLAHDLAMQVAATNPRSISPEELPRAENVRPEEVSLLLQPFIRDSGRTIQDVINEAVAQTGENIRLKRFTRFELGA